jgi:hypothetical protein
MRNFPIDPMRQHSLLMSAVNKSILIGDRDYREAKAVVAVARHIRKEGDK